MFNSIAFIEKKRDGGKHSDVEFKTFVDAVMSGEVADYQISAWLMAAYLNGLDDDETMWFTDALAKSGDCYSFDKLQHTVDKHSTGGVGDKATLILLPLAASCGAVVSKLSGPGLGYTGGTVDKLESIPGMSMHLSTEQFHSQLSKIGCAISGHAKDLAPAEGKFYKLRDVTGTVPSIPLITSSIISKKLAGGAESFVFDVKCGSGAFMKDIENARLLAQNLVKVSKKLNKNAVAVITDMESPLGEWVGNSAEVYEALEILNGRGPSDTRELCTTLCGEMLTVSGIAKDITEGKILAEKALDNGTAFAKFKEVVREQGGNTDALLNPLNFAPQTKFKHQIKSSNNGYISAINALAVGEALRLLGGGRLRFEDKIDHSVAIHICKKPGDKVMEGDTVIEFYYNDKVKFAEAIKDSVKLFNVSKYILEKNIILDYIK